jgi:hypothetical protein
MSVANRWHMSHVNIDFECRIICSLNPCENRCACSRNLSSCSLISTRKRTFFHQWNRTNSSQSNMFIISSLNLQMTRSIEQIQAISYVAYLFRFLEFSFRMDTCHSLYGSNLSIEYSRNFGLTWHLFRYIILVDCNQSAITVHEDFFDDMHNDNIDIRLRFPMTLSFDQQFEHVRYKYNYDHHVTMSHDIFR